MKYLSILLVFILSGCEVGYMKQNNSIAWVHRNEGTGKVANVLNVTNPVKIAIISKNYAIDDEKVFWKQMEIKYADPSSFTLLNSEYSFAEDDQSVYFQNRPIPGVSPGLFIPIAHSYGVSNNNVFYRTHIIVGAVPSEFIISDFEKSDVYGCYLAADFFDCKKSYEP